MNLREKGNKGESLAARYLRSLGYEIIDSQFRARSGEVDLIVTKDNTLVFVEVKFFDFLPLASLENSINCRKIKRIINTARSYLFLFPVFRDHFIRFDVIFVSRTGEAIEHLPNAFTESGFS